MKAYIAILLLVLALGGSFRIIAAAAEGEKAVKLLRDAYGERSPGEWSSHAIAYELFHHQEAGFSGTLYLAPFAGFFYGVLGYIGLAFGLASKPWKVKLISAGLTILLVGALIWPWINHGDSIEIVARVVD